MTETHEPARQMTDVPPDDLGDDHDPAAGDGPARDEPADDAHTGEQVAPRSSRLPWIIAVVSVLVAAASVVTAVVLADDARQRTADLEAVEQAAGSFALTLTTWDASDGMHDTREELRAAGTGAFATDVDELFGGTDDLAALQQMAARSSGEVSDVLVQQLDGDTAVALVVVIQRLTTEVTEGEEVAVRYARLNLLREDGDWLVEQVDLVVDALQEVARRPDLTEMPGLDLWDEAAPDGAEGTDGDGGSEEAA